MADQPRKSQRGSTPIGGSRKPRQTPNGIELQVGEKWPDGVTVKVETIPGAGARIDVEAMAESQLVEAVIERAVAVIGDRAQAMRWLGTPVRALDYATPISRLHGPQGQDDVLRILTQLEHGVL